MNEKDCYIVKDLSLGYIEDTLNPNTKKFIEKHLSECTNCKDYYNYMKVNILEDNNIEEKNKDKIEINYLKKIRTHINILKTMLIIIFIFSIVIISFFAIKYYYINNIFERAYNRIEIMKKSDNYKLSKKTISRSYLGETTSLDVTFTWYYKDGKYKIKYGDNSTIYLEDGSYNKICIHDDLKQIEYYKQDFIEQNKGNPINIYWEVSNYKNLYSIANILGLNVKEGMFEGKECYILRNGNDKSYQETWIDKNSLNLVRTISKSESKIYTEVIYEFSENVVTDDIVDSAVLNTERYKDYKVLEITNNATEEIKLYNKLVDKYEQN